MQPRPAVLIEALSHTYDGGPVTTRALDGAGFFLMPGDWCMLVGPNGAGKSTLLDVLAGRTVWNGTGRVEIDGKSLKRLPAPQLSRMVFHVRQDPLRGTAQELTVAEHLVLADVRRPGTWWPLGPRARARYRSILAPYGLEQRLEQPVFSLSGGERQLLTLLLAQLREVRLLLVDEALSNLDEGRARACLIPLQRLADHGAAIIMVTHDLHAACEQGNRLVAMRHGKVILDAGEDEKKSWTPPALWELLDTGKRGCPGEVPA